MAKKKPEELRDIEECKKKINRILDEYGCTLISADEWHSVLILDTDTQETCAALEQSYNVKGKEQLDQLSFKRTTETQDLT